MTNIIKTFEEKVIDFMDELKSYPTNGKIFNTWTDSNEYDKDSNSPKKRCDNLEKYLKAYKNAKYLLIGESPSYGCRFSGIAMTSEYIMKNKLKDLDLFSTSEKSNGKERTATIVWDVIGSSKNFVLWNAFPYHYKKEKDGQYQTPSLQDVNVGVKILEKFLELFPDAEIICVGGTAEKTFKRTSQNRVINRVYHPSRYKKEFVEGMKKYLSVT